MLIMVNALIVGKKRCVHLRDADKNSSEGRSHQALPKQGNQVTLSGIVDHMFKLLALLPELHQLPEDS